MRECDFKNYVTDFKNMVIKLNRMYDVKAFSPRQKFRLSLTLNSQLDVKPTKSGLYSAYADTDSAK